MKIPEGAHIRRHLCSILQYVGKNNIRVLSATTSFDTIILLENRLLGSIHRKNSEEQTLVTKK